MNVVYRPVPGRQDVYAGTDGSIVKSGKGILKQKLYDRYMVVYLGGRGTTLSVHSLVAAAFFGLPKRGQVVRHGEGGQFDNTPGNLCYGTQKENIADCIAAGKHPSAIRAAKKKCDKGHEFTPENTYVPPKQPQLRNCKICRKALRREAYERQCAAEGKTPKPPRTTPRAAPKAKRDKALGDN